MHAHPDDETITTGGILARYAAEGVRTVVLTCTSGEVGLNSPEAAEATDLGAERRGELAEALRILGVTRHIQLGYRDSGMAGTPENQDPACFYQADAEQAVRSVVRVIRDERPDVMVTYDEKGGYGHPDHVRAHEITRAAFQAAGDAARFPEDGAPWTPPKLYDVLFPRSYVQRFVETLRAAGIAAPWTAPAGVEGVINEEAFGSPDDQVTTVVDVGAYAPTKRAALAAHRTQMPPDHFLMRMTPAHVQTLWAQEFFYRHAGPGMAGAETDLFAGLAP